MFCTKCGTQNVLETEKCIACGEPLQKTNSNIEPIAHTSQNNQPLETTIYTPNNKAGIRKAIKADSKSKITGPFIGATAIYFAILIATTFIFNLIINPAEDITQINWPTVIIESITYLFVAVLNYGLISAALDISRGQKVSLNTIIGKPFDNISKILIIYAILLVFYWLGFAIGYTGIFILVIAFFAVTIYFTPVYEGLLCILADENNKNISFQEALKKANNITKGHKIEYYGMQFSFIGWHLLSLLTLGILYIWLIPYIRISIANMYRQWIKEANYNSSEKGISNGAIITLVSAGGCGCITVFIGTIVAIITLVLPQLGYYTMDQLVEDIQNNHEINIEENFGFDDIQNNTNAQEVTIGNKSNTVTFILPNGFSKNFGSNTIDYGSYYNGNYSRISYTYYNENSDLQYEDGKKYFTNYRYQNHQYEDSEFITAINNKNVKCFVTKETSPYGTITYKALAVYPINQNNSAEIEITLYEQDGPINQTNIKNYIIVK